MVNGKTIKEKTRQSHKVDYEAGQGLRSEPLRGWTLCEPEEKSRKLRDGSQPPSPGLKTEGAR